MTKKTSKKIQEKLYLQYLFGNVMMDEGQQTSSNINKLLISDRPKAHT